MYQLPTFYSFRDLAQTRFYRSRSLREGQRSNHTITLHTRNLQPMSLPSINFLHLMVSKIQPGQDFIGQGHCSKVNSRSHHDVAHLQLITNVPTKYQLPTFYGFQDLAQTIFYRSVRQGQRSNHTIVLHTYNLQPMALPSINFLHLTVSKI